MNQVVEAVAAAPRAPIIAVLNLDEELTTTAPLQAAVDALERAAASSSSSSTEDVPSTSSSSRGSSKWVIDSTELLTSTWEHRLWTWTSMGLMGASLAEALSHVQTTGDAQAVAVALFAAYVLADLGTGVYHWGVDNYGDGNTPMFGRQIAAFQGHHQRPWTITQREFCNNVHQVGRGGVGTGSGSVVWVEQASDRDWGLGGR
jgi:ubiquitin-conjugating enzyme E2 variant